MVQLTRDSYGEFQQEKFNFVMRLKRRDKQQQMYQHAIGMSMVQPGLDLAPVSYVSHPDAGPTAADATYIYTHTTSVSTAAAFKTFTAALSTDIYSGTCTNSTDPQPGSTAKHAATAPHASDGSATAANAATAGNTTTSAKIAFHTVTAANTVAAAANTNTSADKAAAHTAACKHVYITTWHHSAPSTNCPKFTAAAHTTPQPTNIKASSLTGNHFLPAAGHVATSYSHRE